MSESFNNKAMANPMEVSIAVPCANADCKEQGKQRCSQCKSIWYCSEACQKVDWHFHKLLCWLAASSKSKPNPHVRRAILIHPGKKPAFSWLPVALIEDLNSSTPEQHTAVGASITDVPPAAIHHNSILTSTDDRKIRAGDLGEGEVAAYWVLTCGPPDRDEGELNTCVNRLLGDRLTRPARGFRMFVAQTKVGERRFVVDIGTRQFTQALFNHAENSNKREMDRANVPASGQI